MEGINHMGKGVKETIGGNLIVRMVINQDTIGKERTL